MWRSILTHSLFWMLSLNSIMLHARRAPVMNEANLQRGEPGDIQVLIVGGRPVNCEDFPYQVNFIVDDSYFCGGFIVSDRYIVTAAHCAQNVDPSTVVLRTGSSYRQNGTIIPIESVTPYPGYDNPPFDKDIAVMKTKQPIVFGPCTQPIPITAKGDTPQPGSQMTVSGWGLTLPGAPTLPNRLMAVNLTIIARRQCERAYSDVFTENMICAGNYYLGGKSACQGDSGGVGAIKGVAKGVVSFGRICGQPLAPSVFTDISAPLMRDFITTMTGL